MGTYDYRRKLTHRELIPAVGAGVGAGVAVAYLAQLWLRREPLAARTPSARARDGAPAAPARR